MSWLDGITNWWTWVWASSGSWWWAGKSTCCSPWGRKESDMTEWLNCIVNLLLSTEKWEGMLLNILQYLGMTFHKKIIQLTWQYAMLGQSCSCLVAVYLGWSLEWFGKQLDCTLIPMYSRCRGLLPWGNLFFWMQGPHKFQLCFHLHWWYKWLVREAGVTL